MVLGPSNSPRTYEASGALPPITPRPTHGNRWRATFCAKAIAGIGSLPDTVADRSIPIRLERRIDSEPVEKFLKFEVEPIAIPMRDRIAAWADEHKADLRGIHPGMPEQLSDRMHEGCEVLITIADSLNCADQARTALVEVLSGERLDDRESLRLRLLRDVRAVFEFTGKPRIATESLLKGLAADEEAPWRNYYGRGLDPRDLAALLKQYGIESTTINLGKTAEGQPDRRKGYKKQDFHDAWSRYV